MDDANQKALGSVATEQKTEINLEVPYAQKISRLFIFRFLWVYIFIWPLMFWAIWIGLVGFVHFWYQLILGRRNEMLWKKRVRFFRHLMRWNSYFQALTDKRPSLVGE